jgi:Zn-dependent protease with chaperone function
LEREMEELEKFLRKSVFINSLPLILIAIFLCHFLDTFTAYLVFLNDPEFFFENELNSLTKEAFRTGNFPLLVITDVQFFSSIFASLVLSKFVVSKLVGEALEVTLKKLWLQSILFSITAAASTNIFYGLLKHDFLATIIYSGMNFLAILPPIQIFLYFIRRFRKPFDNLRVS